MKTNKVTRLEIIDHTTCEHCGGKSRFDESLNCINCKNMGSPGRKVVMFDDNKQIDLELQDDDYTLKVFIHPRYSE